MTLMTRKEGELERPGRTLRLAVESLILRMTHNRRLAEVYERRNHDINEILALIENPGEHVRVHAIVRPANALEIDRLTTDADMLRSADKEAQRTVFAYLDDPPDTGR